MGEYIQLLRQKFSQNRIFDDPKFDKYEEELIDRAKKGNIGPKSFDDQITESLMMIARVGHPYNNSIVCWACESMVRCPRLWNTEIFGIPFHDCQPGDLWSEGGISREPLSHDIDKAKKQTKDNVPIAKQRAEVKREIQRKKFLGLVEVEQRV